MQNIQMCVLDFSTGIIHFHQNDFKKDFEIEEVEEWLAEQGYRLSDCQYMINQGLTVYTHDDYDLNYSEWVGDDEE